MVTASANLQAATKVDADRDAGAVDVENYGRGDGWRGFYSRYSAHMGYGLAAIVTLIGWLGRDNRHISAEYGLGYALGILGSVMMLVLLLYPVRKRLRFMRIFGPTKTWFRSHMILGVLGPILILYHSNFQLGSLNSQVALYCTLIVAGSGLIGRYIYSKIHYGLYGRKMSLQGLMKQATLETGSGVAAFMPELLREMAEFDRQVLVMRDTVLASATLPLKLAWKTRIGRMRLNKLIKNRLAEEAKKSPIVAKHRPRMQKACKKYVARHFAQIRRVAEFGFYERLFSLWHVGHLPFFYILVLSATIHVIAVHMY